MIYQSYFPFDLIVLLYKSHTHLSTKLTAIKRPHCNAVNSSKISLSLSLTPMPFITYVPGSEEEVKEKINLNWLPSFSLIFLRFSHVLFAAKQSEILAG